MQVSKTGQLNLSVLIPRLRTTALVVSEARTLNKSRCPAVIQHEIWIHAHNAGNCWSMRAVALRVCIAAIQHADELTGCSPVTESHKNAYI